MTMMADTHTLSAPATAPAQGALSRVWGKITARYARYMAYRKTVSELSGLTAHGLHDIGMNRSMVRSMAYEEAYRSM